MKKYLLLLLIPLLFILNSVKAEINIPDRPENGIYDPSGYLSSKSEESIDKFKTATGETMNVFIVDTFDNAVHTKKAWDIAYAWKLFDNKYGGRESLLLLIAVKDGEFRLLNGASAFLYTTVTDEIDELATDKMKDKDYDGLVDKVTKLTEERLLEAISKIDRAKEVKEEKKAERNKVFLEHDDYGMFLMLVIAFIWMSILAIFEFLAPYLLLVLVILLIVSLVVYIIKKKRSKTLKHLNLQKDKNNFNLPFE